MRVGSTDYPRFAMKRRVLNYLSYVALAIPRALFVRCDVVLAMTDPPFEGIVGAIVATAEGQTLRLQHSRHVSGHGGGRRDRRARCLLARVWERLHRWALRRATRVIVLGEDMRERIIAKGVDPAARRNRSRWRGYFSADHRHRLLDDPRSFARFAAISDSCCCTPEIWASTARGKR